ncbi:MAG: SDR family oxidoreductase [Myxococcota bacterium]|nr:SDR family oxidoreductase [Myxococcota bacterium]
MPVSNQPVVVTGASGFIASHIVARLLEAGYRVRGTVRSPDSEKETAHLRSLPGASERLELTRGELLEPGAFDDVVAGCQYVLHTASPYALDVKDPQKDLVDPAVMGTRNVLASCKKAGTVERVVVTSSMAAITDEPDADHVLTEDDWNEKSTLERNAYYLSKTLAEKEAWRFVAEEKPGFDVVVINPFMVIGPSRSPGLNTSNQLFADMLKGVYPGIMNLTWGFVDVRDVALAHVRAFETKAASGRYICANTTATMRELVEWLNEDGYTAHKLPARGLDCAVGDHVVRLTSYLQPKGVGSYLRTHVGRAPRFDNAKIRRELGLEFRPLRDTVRETVADVVRWGHVPASR